MYSIRALVGDRSAGKEKSPRDGSWREWFITRIYNFIGLPNIFSKIYLEFLFCFDQLLLLFFSCYHYSPGSQSQRKWLCGENTGNKYGMSYINKACQFEMISPGSSTFKQGDSWAPKWSESKQHCLLQTCFQILGISVFSSCKSIEQNRQWASILN